MERMPVGKSEKKPTHSEALNWCLQRLREKPELEKYAVVLEQGKRDIASARVPEWDFMMVLKEIKFMLDADDPEDDVMMIQIEKLIDDVRQTRHSSIEDKAGVMERQSHNRDPHRHTDEPLPPFTGGVAEA